MDTIVISKERNFLHVDYENNNINYSFYNNKGHLIDGGEMENKDNIFNNISIPTEIITSFKDTINFTEPFIYITGKDAENLLEMIEEEDYQNLQNKVNKSYNLNDEHDLSEEREF